MRDSNNMTKFLGYKCSICGKEYEPIEIRYTCPDDGGNLDIVLDYNQIQKNSSPQNIFSSKDFSIWRYLPLLPVESPKGKQTPLYAVGYTPTFIPNGLAFELGINHLWLKDESRNPTASFKDRASAVIIARAIEIGADIVVTASTGNAGAALAGMAAAVGHQAVIFAPKNAPPAKIAQLLVYDAQVILVDGTYDDAFDLTIKASKEYGWYCRNTGYNPFTAEGKKTAAFEIWEWMSLNPKFADLDRPLSIFVSVGDGNIISGIHKGLKDLQTLGWLKRMPRIFGVQAEGSAAIAKAYDKQTENISPVQANTIADSISVDLPRDGIRALRAATKTGGAYITVTDEEILSAIASLGKTGIFAEPAGATAFAGLKKAVQSNIILPDDPVLVINTGSGLKDIKAAMQAVHAAPIIKPSLQELNKLISNLDFIK